MIKKDKIYKLILEGNCDEAFKEISRIVKTHNQSNTYNLSASKLIDEIVLTTNIYFENEKNKVIGIISFEQSSIIRNKCISSLLKFATQFQEFSPISENAGPKETKVNLYIPPEEASYSLSILSEEFDDGFFNNRLLAFSTLIENIILSDCIYSDVCDDSIDKILASNINTFSLNNFFELNYKPKRFSYQEYGGVFSEFHDITNFDEVNFISNSNAFWKKHSKGLSKKSMTAKYFDSIYDYFKFASTHLKFDTLEEQEALNLFYNVKADSIHEINPLSKDMLLQLCFGMINSELITAKSDNFQWYPINFKTNILQESPVFAPSSMVLLGKMNDTTYSEAEILNDFVYNNFSFTVKFPILFSYIIGKADNIDNVFEIANDLRNSNEIKLYKRWCGELDFYLNQGMQVDAKNMIKYAEQEINKITGKFDLPEISTQFSFPPNYLFENTQLDSYNANLMLLKKMYNETISPFLLNDKLKKIFKR